jgi:alpha-tubulin suppressor-like RCC1 family protein
MRLTFVVLDNGRVHYFEDVEQLRGIHSNKEQSRQFTISSHKIQSISSGFFHSVMVTMTGAVFGFGRNDSYQLGVVDPSALSGDIVSTPTEVFAAITKFKGAVRLHDGTVGRLHERPVLFSVTH